MKLELKSFRTKVARRIFVLFVLCAIVPISALALISFIHVRAQLLDQSQLRLRQGSKALAVSIYERLSLVKAEMKIIASSRHTLSDEPARPLAEDLVTQLKERFSALALIHKQGRYIPLFGRVASPPDLSSAEKRHIRTGKPLLNYHRTPDSSLHVFMLVSLDPEDPDKGMLLGEINGLYLWQAAEGLPPGTEVCVLDRSGNMLFTSFHGSISQPAQLFRDITFARSGHFDWTYEAKKYVAGYWTLFLEPNFFLPEWILVVSESEDVVFAPVADFRKVFPVIMIFSLGMVFLLSFTLIRKNTVPIEILREATQKIAQGMFGHKVEIKSGDEFEGLAESFNDMSAKIKEGQSLLVKAAKLSTMGQMMAGIMHEIKQPLTAIHGLIQLSMMDNIAPESRKRLETTMLAVERLNAILGRFKSFSHMSEGAMQLLSVNGVLDEVHRLLEHQLMMRRVECRMAQEETLPRVVGDNQSLQQVFSNMLMNAADALESKQDGGRLINVTTRSSEGLVFVEVQDNGCGIPMEIQKMIFDPFFTTKPPDKGTGLGMAIVESILHQHYARIELESEVGVGTKFTIVFPVPSRSGSQEKQSDTGDSASRPQKRKEKP